MQHFQARRGYNPWRYRLIALILLIILLAMVRGVWSLVQKNQLAREHYKETENKLTDLEKQKASLALTVANLKTPRGIETEIRKNFSVVKNGEKVITIVDSKDTSSTTDTTTNNQSWWQALVNVFK